MEGFTMAEELNNSVDHFNAVLKGLTQEQKHDYWSNRLKTRRELNVPKGWHLHHKDTTLIYTDIERYIQWLPEDLIILSPSEHTALHNYGKNRTTNRYKVELHRTAIGRKWCNNGEVNYYLKPNEPLPEGYTYGRLTNINSMNGMKKYWETHQHLKGSDNPASRPEVREKISRSRKGAHRVYREDGSYYYTHEED